MPSTQLQVLTAFEDGQVAPLPYPGPGGRTGQRRASLGLPVLPGEGGGRKNAPASGH